MSIIMLYLVASMLAVIYFDVTRFIIPNWLVGSLLIAYPLAVILSPVAVDWKMALVGMLGVFALGYVIFALRVMGGGDVKLIIVLSLWVGLEKLAVFGINFAIIGGVFTLFLLLVRKIIPVVAGSGKKLPRIIRNKEPVPYGVAIAGAFLLMLAVGDVPLFPLS
jgi:prepilin peptidase CpaA